MAKYMNPAYIMPAVILCCALVYFLYYAIDRVGLATSTAEVVVTAKTHTPGTTNYVNRIAGDRSWTQAQPQSDFYAISVTVENEPTVGLVTREKFDQLKVNDRVRATYRRARITGKVWVDKID